MPDSARARALVLERPRHLVIHDIPLPALGDDDALVRVEACGLCGTDHEQYTGELAGGFAFVPGHETIGIIETIGPKAAQRWQVAEGDRIAVEVLQSCRACDACLAGEYARCKRHGLADMYGFIDVDRAPGLWGGYAEYQYLAPDSMVLSLPDNLDPILATLFNPLGAGIRWGATLPDTGDGDVVAVLGPGVRGLCVAAAAKEAGAGFVMVTGFGSRDAERLAHASDFGADLAVNVAAEDPVAALRHAAGRLADVVVDVTAKFAQAIKLVRTAGTVVVAGTRGWGVGAPGFFPDMVVMKEIRILGALGVDTTAYRAALDLLASGRYPFADLPRRCVGLDGAADLLATMAGDRDDVPPVHGVVTP
jgi:alcohol dehydrogenase